MTLYRGTIAFDDDADAEHQVGRDPIKRLGWYKAYWKTDKYRAYKRAYMRRYRERSRTLRGEPANASLAPAAHRWDVCKRAAFPDHHL